MRASPPRALALALLSALLLAACDTAVPNDDGGFMPSGDEVVAGVNLDALFAPPTTDEEAAVRSVWAGRDQALDDRYVFALVEEREGDDGAQLRVYRASDAETGAVLFHGVVRLPLRLAGDNRQRPVLLVLPDGDGGASADLLTDGTLPVQSAERDDLVFALLAYRGEPLRVAGATFPSGAAPSAYDGDADDALAFLHFVRGLGQQALVDRERVGVLGLGRGGGVALLTEARTSLYDVVVDLAGPTDLFLGAFRSRVRNLLQGRSGGDFPAVEALADEVVYPLRDSTMTVAQARRALLLRSPRYFVLPPPFIVVAHGAFDDVVPVEHSRVLDLRDPRPVGGSAGVFLELPDLDHTAILTEGEVVSLVTGALRDHLSI